MGTTKYITVNMDTGQSVLIKLYFLFALSNNSMAWEHFYTNYADAPLQNCKFETSSNISVGQ